MGWNHGIKTREDAHHAIFWGVVTTAVVSITVYLLSVVHRNDEWGTLIVWLVSGEIPE